MELTVLILSVALLLSIIGNIVQYRVNAFLALELADRIRAMKRTMLYAAISSFCASFFLSSMRSGKQGFTKARKK